MRVISTGMRHNLPSSLWRVLCSGWCYGLVCSKSMAGVGNLVVKFYHCRDKHWDGSLDTKGKCHALLLIGEKVSAGVRIEVIWVV